jgi:hypothetical protein
MSIERRLFALEMAVFESSGTTWHEIGTLPNGAMFGKLGAMTHIIDPETHRAISKGYHVITPQGFGRYLGQTGAWTEEFKVGGRL